MRPFLAVLAVIPMIANGAPGAASQRAGAVCIAPFKTDFSGPQMLMDHPGPGAKSKYSFRIDRKLEATVGSGERRLITGVPADRKVLVEVRLNGRPVESFWIDLRKAEKKRACLWLYEGYWNWQVDPDWERKGCQCDVKKG